MHNARILIVDDEPSICDIMSKILLREGYQTQQAYSGSKAVSLFAEQAFDLVLLDLALPDMDGLEVARQMLAQNSMIPIVLVSARGTIPKAVEATKIGVYDFLEKPPERDRILLTVRNALAKGQLEQQLAQYQSALLDKYKMIGQSAAMKKVYALIEKIAPTATPVLITGENGVGKELVAAAIHHCSPRANKMMVKINCTAIQPSLIESELFGHSKGAFTGALQAKKGRFEIADDSTLFLDEIGEMDEAMQVKLLRFLETGEIQKVGATEISRVDVRLLAATNRDLHEEIKARRFRRDLYYRIDVMRIHVPALRERPEDIPPLLEHFIAEHANANGLPLPHVTPAALRYLKAYHWPGNVRELRHFVQRLMVLSYNETIDLENIRPYLEEDEANLTPATPTAQTLHDARQQFERQYVLDILHETNGHVTRAAQMLGMDRANLYRKMRQLGIEIDSVHQ